MSRRLTLEKQKSIKQTVYFFGGGLLFLFIFFIIGIPLLINLSAFLSNLLTPKKTVTKKNEKFIQQPTLEIPYEATNSAQISIDGFGAVSVNVDLFVNNRKVRTTSDKNGTFYFSDVQLVSGDNEIYAVTTDRSSTKEAKSDISTVTYDNKKPTLTLDNVTDGQQFELNNQITIKGKLDEDGTLYINDRFIMVNSDKTFSADYTLQDGDNVLKFRAIDKAGNFVEKEIKVIFRK